MSIKRGVIIFPLLLILVFLLSCTPSVPTEKQCSSALDCVKTTCCHASDALNKNYGPDCSGQICTQECVEGTIDCGQGTIQCVKGACAVVLG